jgi:hypothetical protein
MENMKRNCLILTAFIVVCVLLLQIGLQKQAVAAEKTKPELTAPKPAPPSAKAETPPEPNKPAPKIKFEKVTHDFGKIAPGTKNVCEFKFANTGDSLLKITKVSKTCGCTPYTLAKKVYEPGESGTLKVKYNASKRPASITRRLYVSSNDKANPKVTLIVKAKIVQKVDYNPERLNLLLKGENAGCPEIMLNSTDNKPFAIRQFKSTDNCITADYDPSVKAAKFVLQPKVDMEKLQKGLNGRVEISLTHPGYDTVTIPFAVLSKFKSEPSSIVVFKAAPQKPITKEVWILSNYDEDFEIESALSQKGTIKVLSHEKVDNRYKFKLEITPPPPVGKRKFFNDVFLVNIKGGEKLRIICRGFYLKKA